MAAAPEPELSGALRLTDLRHVLDTVVEQAYGGLRQLADRLPGEPDEERWGPWLQERRCGGRAAPTGAAVCGQLVPACSNATRVPQPVLRA